MDTLCFINDSKRLTNNQLAEKYGVHRNTISRWKERLGLPSLTLVHDEEFISDVSGKMRIRELCEKYSMDKKSISRRIKVLGTVRPKWKYEKNGYILIYQPEHPYATSTGYVLEHRLVMEDFLGRYLDPEEIVHHEDENKTNNDIKNLRLFKNQAEHMAYHQNLRKVI